MSGTRYHNFREGDRSEYLAVYMLSALGLVTEVPRQEDIGFDLICNVAETESGSLAFRHHYAVSVKSASMPNVILEPPDSKEEDPVYSDHYNWLFHLEIPLLLAVVDKNQQKLSMFSTLPAWFVYYEKLKSCGIIELVPRMETEPKQGDVGKPEESSPVEKAGGRNKYTVDLGFPIIEISVGELKDKELLRRRKATLRHAIDLGKLSAGYAAMGIPFFWWFNVTRPGGYDAGVSNPDGFNGGMAWFVATPPDVQQLEKMLRGIAPSLMSAALLFKGNQPQLLAELRGIMRMLPQDAIPRAIQEKLPEIYG